MNNASWSNLVCFMVLMQAMVIAVDPRHGLVLRIVIPVVGVILCAFSQIVARREDRRRDRR